MKSLLAWKSVYHVHAWCPEARGELWTPWNWSYESWLWATMWELGTEPVSSGKEASAINHWGMSLAPIIIILSPPKYPGANTVLSIKKKLNFFSCVGLSFYSISPAPSVLDLGVPLAAHLLPLSVFLCVISSKAAAAAAVWFWLSAPPSALCSCWHSACGPTQ